MRGKNAGTKTFSWKNRRPPAGAEKAVPSETLKTLGLLIAVLSAVGALFGYGVAMGFSRVFGLGIGTWFSSPLELISLSGEGVIGVISALASRTDIFEKLLGYMFGYAAFSGAALFAGICLSIAVSMGRHRLKSWSSKLVSRNRPPAPKSDVNSELSWSRVKRILAVTLGGAIAGFFGIPLFGVALLAVFVVLSIVPMLGLAGGSSYAVEAVLKPTACVSSPASLQEFREQKNKSDTSKVAFGADCVEVVDRNTSRSIKGRLIVSRSSYVVLYRPGEDDVVVVQMRNGSLKSISALDSGKTLETGDPDLPCKKAKQTD
jgi:hypothetical protein